jgi:hypothetical protein
MSSKETDQKAQELLQPILDVFTGTDGGVAFSILRHSALPLAIKVNASSVVDAFETVSNICRNILELQ